MADLSHLGLAEMVKLGAELRNIGQGASSMEQVAARIVDALAQYFTVDGKPELVLTRFYVTTRYQLLEPEQQAAAREILGREPDPQTRCMVLLGTRGAEAAWNSRRSSQGHKAIPLPDSAFVSRLPMVAGVFEGLGLDPRALENPEQLADAARRQFSVFLVEHALGSPKIPAQADFVQKHGVASVIAFGGVLPTGELFFTLMFARAPITREVADLFGPLALSVKLAVMPYSSRKPFAVGHAS
jgi:hypothetical protein